MTDVRRDAGGVIGECYDLALEARVDGARSEYRFTSADGVCSKRSFRTPELLLADVLWEENPGRVLVPEANYGVVGVLLAAGVQHVRMTESSARAARLCETNAAANGVDAAVSLTSGISALGDMDAWRPNGHHSECAGDEGGFDVVTERDFDAVAFAPKPYAPLDLGAQRVVDAAARLASGGRVYLAAAERTGLNRYERVLGEVAERVTCVAERDDVCVLRASVPDGGVCHDGGAYVTPRAFDATVAGVDLSLVSVPGVFSATGLDDGTRLLAATADVHDGDRVLDLCCGYGALGAYAASVADCEVVLTDDDRVATACAERSLDATGVRASVVTADGVSGVDGESFDRILCNPPTHATDSVLRHLFDGARRVLAPGGDLLAVHHRELDLRAQLRSFDDVDRVTADGEHVVVRAR